MCNDDEFNSLLALIALSGMKYGLSTQTTSDDRITMSSICIIADIDNLQIETFYYFHKISKFYVSKPPDFSFTPIAYGDILKWILERMDSKNEQ